MKCRNASILIVSAILLILNSFAFAYQTMYLNDGGYHKFDYIYDGQVFIDMDNPGVGTQVELVDGGGIAPNKGYGSIAAFNDSKITMSGGQMGWSLSTNDRSKAEITGGYVGGDFGSTSINRAYMSGGSVNAVVAFGAGSFDISGGIIRWALETQGSTEAIVTGGDIARINCLNSSRIYMSGGTISGHIYAGYSGEYNNTSLISFYGSDFAINSNPVVLGTYASSYCSGQGWVTGTLADGSILNTTFELNGSSDIKFIPEPVTLLLFTFGGLALRGFDKLATARKR
jgi:hypothetical protein